MPYSTYTPRAELQPFVEKISFQEWVPESVRSTTTILPVGTMDLLFHYGDPYLHYEEDTVVAQPAAYIAGQRTRSFEVGASGFTGIVIANLKPWGFAGFSGYAASEFTDQFIDASCVFSPSALADLCDALKQDTPPEAKVDFVQDFLASQLIMNMDDLVITAVQSLYQQPHLKIECLAKQLGISKRQLDRRFMTVAGLTPKKFQTVIRLQRSLGLLQEDLCVTAHEAGYFDQAHMNHDYQRLINSTPSYVLGRSSATPLMRFYAEPANMSRFYNYLYLQ